MEDLKWLLRKCGLLILLLLIFVIVGVICWGKMHEEEQKVAEEVWEPPVEIENSEAPGNGYARHRPCPRRGRHR